MSNMNPMQAWNAWWALSWQAAKLGWDAQNVIALRMAHLTGHSARSQTERNLMVSEKVAALAEAQMAAATAALTGGHSHQIAKTVLGVYKKRVRANHRRLSK